MKRYKILSSSIFYNRDSFSFSLTASKKENSIYHPYPIYDFISKISITSYTFCIDISDECNLNCDYCFNKHKSGQHISFEIAIKYLERMFKVFPDGKKYFIDLSGKGEPLFHLKEIVQIADWCKRKQDEIRVEVLPQLVCNGTLLTKEVAKILQKHRVLFGVSLDGNEHIHDMHRKYKNGNGSYSTIISNIKQIRHRDYIGCAITLTNDIFSLTDSVTQLATVFKTISYRPARGEYGFDQNGVKKWIKEYDILSMKIIEDIKNNNCSILLPLMNGDDFFGRYLCRAFGKQITINRCDAEISRFALDLDGNIYGCPAMTTNKELSLKMLSKNNSKNTLLKSAEMCVSCDFKIFCGGECKVEYYKYGIRKKLCLFKKHLILLANYIQLICEKENPKLEQFLENFVQEKMKRFTTNKELIAFLEKHPKYSFSKGKAIFDRQHRKY